eukprot:TRINITY_DN759_c0_g1_i5.p1 TRINITY_DN759_c0_g1~~TRINITY_DN759_c0_g1_i5.p1  ORF type:complete len:1483 (+),score=284.32 TRINITY_DN759_c0_g1_i5:85-4449(+)
MQPSSEAVAQPSSRLREPNSTAKGLFKRPAALAILATSFAFVAGLVITIASLVMSVQQPQLRVVRLHIDAPEGSGVARLYVDTAWKEGLHGIQLRGAECQIAASHMDASVELEQVTYPMEQQAKFVFAMTFSHKAPEKMSEISKVKCWIHAKINLYKSGFNIPVNLPLSREVDHTSSAKGSTRNYQACRRVPGRLWAPRPQCDDSCFITVPGQAWCKRRDHLIDQYLPCLPCGQQVVTSRVWADRTGAANTTYPYGNVTTQAPAMLNIFLPEGHLADLVKDYLPNAKITVNSGVTYYEPESNSVAMGAQVSSDVHQTDEDLDGAVHLFVPMKVHSHVHLPALSGVITKASLGHSKIYMPDDYQFLTPPSVNVDTGLNRFINLVAKTPSSAVAQVLGPLQVVGWHSSEKSILSQARFFSTPEPTQHLRRLLEQGQGLHLDETVYMGSTVLAAKLNVTVTDAGRQMLGAGRVKLDNTDLGKLDTMWKTSDQTLEFSLKVWDSKNELLAVTANGVPNASLTASGSLMQPGAEVPTNLARVELTATKDSSGSLSGIFKVKDGSQAEIGQVTMTGQWPSSGRVTYTASLNDGQNKELVKITEGRISNLDGTLNKAATIHIHSGSGLQKVGSGDISVYHGKKKLGWYVLASNEQNNQFLNTKMEIQHPSDSNADVMIDSFQLVLDTVLKNPGNVNEEMLKATATAQNQNQAASGQIAALWQRQVFFSANGTAKNTSTETGVTGAVKVDAIGEHELVNVSISFTNGGREVTMDTFTEQSSIVVKDPTTGRELLRVTESGSRAAGVLTSNSRITSTSESGQTEQISKTSLNVTMTAVEYSCSYLQHDSENRVVFNGSGGVKPSLGASEVTFETMTGPYHINVHDPSKSKPVVDLSGSIAHTNGILDLTSVLKIDSDVPSASLSMQYTHQTALYGFKTDLRDAASSLLVINANSTNQGQAVAFDSMDVQGTLNVYDSALDSKTLFSLTGSGSNRNNVGSVQMSGNADRKGIDAVIGLGSSSNQYDLTVTAKERVTSSTARDFAVLALTMTNKGQAVTFQSMDCIGNLTLIRVTDFLDTSGSAQLKGSIRDNVYQLGSTFLNNASTAVFAEHITLEDKPKHKAVTVFAEIPDAGLKISEWLKVSNGIVDSETYPGFKEVFMEGGADVKMQEGGSYQNAMTKFAFDESTLSWATREKVEISTYKSDLSKSPVAMVDFRFQDIAFSYDVAVTKFDSIVTLDDVSKFDQTQFIEAVKATLPTAGSSARTNVVVESIKFKVEAEYSFSGTVSESIARTSIAATAGVPESAVIVTIGRRLSDGRRLAATKVSAVIETDNKEAAVVITAAAADKDALQKTFQARGMAMSVSVTKEPKTKIEVTVAIVSEDAAGVTAPTKEALAQQVSTQLDTTVQVETKNVQAPVTVAAAKPQATSTTPQAALGNSDRASKGYCNLLLLAPLLAGGALLQ